MARTSTTTTGRADPGLTAPRGRDVLLFRAARSVELPSLSRTAALLWAVAATTAQAQGAPAVGQAPAAAKPASACRMMLAGELAVTFDRNRPIVPGEANGKPVRVLLDTGAFQSMMFRASAARLGVRLEDLGGRAKVAGAGGMSQLYLARLDSFSLAGIKTRRHEMLVGGERAADVDMVIGEEFFSQVDVEFDLRHGKVRLLQPKACTDEEMPYWAVGPYAETPIVSPAKDKLEIEVKVNGAKVRAILDSGAQRSVLTPEAAARAHVRVDAAVAGRGTGVGAAVTEWHYGEIDSFTVGDETINRSKILVSDLFSKAVTTPYTGSRVGGRVEGLPEMLLGADFLGAHHTLISRSHRTVYFTYEGGPVFDVARRASAGPARPATPAPGGAAPDQAASSRPPAGS